MHEDFRRIKKRKCTGNPVGLDQISPRSSWAVVLFNFMWHCRFGFIHTVLLIHDLFLYNLPFIKGPILHTVHVIIIAVFYTSTLWFKVPFLHEYFYMSCRRCFSTVPCTRLKGVPQVLNSEVLQSSDTGCSSPVTQLYLGTSCFSCLFWQTGGVLQSQTKVSWTLSTNKHFPNTRERVQVQRPAGNINPRHFLHAD